VKRAAGLLLAAWFLLAMNACGYHVAGHGSKLPTNLNTLAVPLFINSSQTYRVEQTLTSAVVQEFITRTHYHIINKEDQSADATLRGTVQSTTLAPITFDSRTGRVATVLVQVGVSVSLTDKKGAVIYSNPGYVFREQYQVSSSPSSFFEEQSPALERLAHDFARALVSDVLENY
jgi:outer membrane lipopolysaccharide assembly protein LptE/RlpB